jgi:hypothetical protein
VIASLAHGDGVQCRVERWHGQRNPRTPERSAPPVRERLPRGASDLDGSVELAARTPAVNAAHSLGLKVSAESVGSQILTARPSREAGRATPLG